MRQGCASTSNLDGWPQRFCPVLRHFRNGAHWSFTQVEHATDVVFHQKAKFQPLCAAIVRTARPGRRPRRAGGEFLGPKHTASFQDEVGHDFSTRIHGTCIHHHTGPANLKLYDKFGLIARV